MRASHAVRRMAPAFRVCPEALGVSSSLCIPWMIEGRCLESEVVMRHGDRRPKEKQKFKTRPSGNQHLSTFKKVHEI